MAGCVENALWVRRYIIAELGKGKDLVRGVCDCGFTQLAMSFISECIPVVLRKLAEVYHQNIHGATLPYLGSRGTRCCCFSCRKCGVGSFRDGIVQL